MPGEHWDAFIAGAGPAGTTVARLLAARGLSVLLVDRATFPRDKVCGCCLNGVAVDALERTGLGGLLDDLGAHRLDALDLRGFGRRAEIPLPSGYAVSRRALDLALIREAQRAGAVFRSGTLARLDRELEDGWHVDLTPVTDAEPLTIHARVVLAADGLDGGFLRSHPRFKAISATDSKVGLGLHAAVPEEELPAGQIRMTVGPHGYVGMVRLEDGLVDIAAAVDRSALHGATPEAVIRRTLGQSGTLSEFEIVQRIRGTPALTRQRRVHGGRRLFLLGDAAGFVEPFTGEGMAWALNSALRVAPLAEVASAGWSESLLADWERFHGREVARRQAVSRTLRGVLGRPWLVATMIRVIARAPALTRPVVAGLNRPILERL